MDPSPRRTARPIPASIWTSAAALLVAVVAQTLLVAGQEAKARPGWDRVAFAGLVAVLVLGGLLARRRLAWLWGHYLALLLGALTAFSLGVQLWRGWPLLHETTLYMASSAFGLAVASAALGRRSAMAYFDLVCPACLAPSRMGNDFLFREARCRACGNVW